MKSALGKYPIRLSGLIELACLYAGCFFLSGFLAAVEQYASGNYVLMRYLRFVMQHQTALILGVSIGAIVYHYQGIVKSQTEIRCRIIVGDRLLLIRFRYAVACAMILAGCFTLTLVIQTIANLSISNSVRALAVFALYIGVSALLLGRRRERI